jgi:hypothetical protein
MSIPPAGWIVSSIATGVTHIRHQFSNHAEAEVFTGGNVKSYAEVSYESTRRVVLPQQ